MEMNDDKFLRNLEIERERAELERQKAELMFQRAQAHRKFEDTYNNDEQENLNYQELDDIRIDKDSSSKQKYILLGFILVLLFLITLVTIKLISEPEKANNYSQNNLIDEQKPNATIEATEPNQASEKPINDESSNNAIAPSHEGVVMKVVEEKAPEVQPVQPSQPIETKNVTAEKTTKIDKDIFGIEKATASNKKEIQKVEKSADKETKSKTQDKKEVIKKEDAKKSDNKKDESKKTDTKKEDTKKSEVKKSDLKKPENKKDELKQSDLKNNEIKKDTKKSTQKQNTISEDLWKQTAKKEEAKTVNNNVIFIQVGVFSATPDQQLIDILKKNNFKYTFRKSEIDGKTVSKLFIGGYKSEEKAKEDLAKVRNEINPKAFIPKGQ